jgi:hypothetical protein
VIKKGLIGFDVSKIATPSELYGLIQAMLEGPMSTFNSAILMADATVIAGGP